MSPGRSVVRLLLGLTDAAARSAGQRHYMAGRVGVTRAGESRVIVWVEDDPPRLVELGRDRDVVTFSCECPTATGGGCCEHVWAAGLKAASEGLLAAADPERGDLPGGARSRPPTPRKPAWEQFAQRISSRRTRESGAGAPAVLDGKGRSLLYFLDVLATLDGGDPLFFPAWFQSPAPGVRGSARPADDPDYHRLTLPEDAVDAGIFLMLRGAGGASSLWYGGRLGYRVSPAALDLVLPAVARTGRLHLVSGFHQVLDPGPAFLLDEGPPWRFSLEMRKAEGAEKYLVRGVLSRGEERMGLEEPALLLARGWVFARDRVARLDHADSFTWIVELRKTRSIPVPADEADEFLRSMLSVPYPPPLDLPSELAYSEVSPAPGPSLKVYRPQGARDDELRAEISFDYMGTVVPARPRAGAVYDPDARVLIRRDPVAEEAAEARARKLGVKLVRGRPARIGTLTISPRRLPGAVRALIAEGWRVEAEGTLYRPGGAFRIDVRSGIDWFELEGAMDFGGQQVKLPALLAAVRKGEKMVALGDGTFGMLPEEWLARWGLLGRLGAMGGESLRFGPGQTALLDALLAVRPEVNCDERFGKAREELRRFETVLPEDPPATFAGELRPYQREGLGWFRFLERFGFGGCLADDMGLGKTVQALALLERRRVSREGGAPTVPSLVVAPRSVLFNWEREAARFVPGLRVLAHHGAARGRAPSAFDGHDLVLTTYGTLLRDIRFLKDVRFETVILDEAQAVKNASTATAKAVRLLDAEHRLALSGTPIENHAGELYSLLDFLNPGMLGSAPVFDRCFPTGGGLHDGSRELLARVVRPFVLRRTKAKVAPELPSRTDQTLLCELERPQRKMYDELRAYYRRLLLDGASEEGFGGMKMHVLEALLRLRQAACHPGLIDPKRREDAGAKLDVLLPQLAEVVETEHKALVFSQFTRFLAIVKARLDALGIGYAYLDGSTADRAGAVAKFQEDPDCRLFLVSLKAGGLGLNLTAAEYVFLLDPWWNPATEAQAIDRTHRIGQTRQVFAYRLIARDTVEERVLELQEKKRDLADAIIGADDGPLGRLTRDDLELLLA